MRKLKLSLIAVAATAAALAFTSCDKGGEENFDLTPPSGLVTFETAQLPDEGFLIDSPYSEVGVSFRHDYNAEYGSWSGFAVSRKTDKETPGYGNMYSVYDDGGANGSGQFGVACVFGTSEFTFAGKSERFIKYIYVNNSAYAVLSMRDGDDFAKKFEHGDWFQLTATGYDSAGNETEKKSVYLADYRSDNEADRFIIDKWTKVELSGLGKVNRVAFSLSSSDNGEYGMNTPAYFCIDDISYAASVATE